MKFRQVINSNNLLNNGKSTVSPLYNDPSVLLISSDKAKCFAENFSRNSILDELGISLALFTSKLVKKVSFVVSIYKNVEEVFTDKNCLSASLLSVVSN